jgi:hypothetical protein
VRTAHALTSLGPLLRSTGTRRPGP